MLLNLVETQRLISLSNSLTPTELHQKRRPKGRQLFCPVHPDQQIAGNGKKYFLHMLSREQLKARGMSDKRSQLVINAYPVLVLSNEWLEQLYCPQCGSNHWCHVIRGDKNQHQVSWAPRELWQQVAHVDPVSPNPTVSEYTLRNARRASLRRTDGQRYYDPS